MSELFASRRWVALLIVFLVSFAILINGLEEVPLWSDEGWTIAATDDNNPLVTIRDWAAVDVHPPAFFLGLNVWRIFTGDTILEMRYFSVLISIVGVALAYALGRALFSYRAGLFAALFYGLHDLVNVLTQEVRHYPLQMALVTLALWLYWRFHQRPTRRRGFAFMLAGTALLYTHYWGGFILLAAALHALLTRRNQLRPFALTFGGIGLLFIPWLPALYNQITLERPGGLPHALENTVWVYRVLAFQLLGTPELLWLILMSAGIIGTWAFLPRHWLPKSPGLLLLFAFIIPPLLTIALNVIYPVLSFRALAVVIPPAMILAASGLARFRMPEGGIILAFIVLFSLTTTAAAPIDRPDWPTIADDISARSTSSDVVLLENDTDEFTLVYYLQQTGRETIYLHSERTRLLSPENYEDFMRESLAHADGIWIAKLGWPGISGDVRQELAQMGFTESAPERAYGMYDDRPILLWRLDRQPQTEALVTFGDELRLMRADISAHPDLLTVNLLWSPTIEPTQEYTVSILLFGPDGVENQDSRPLSGQSLTSTWQSDGIYFDSHSIPLENLPPGTYNVGVQVYYFTDETFTEIENIEASDCSDDADCRFIILDTITLE